MSKNVDKMSANYLDYIPVINDKHNAEIDGEGNVTVIMENKGFFNWVAQKFLKKPRYSNIHLEKMGSFIWRHIDGNNTIYDIAGYVGERFGEEAEPLYNRLVQYIRNLESYGFVIVKKEK